MKAANNSETAKRKHPLIGAGVHWRDHRGMVINQAVILDVIPDAKGDIALLQYFEFLLGYPSTRRLVALAELCSSDRWVLYSSIEEMNGHYERVDSARNEYLTGKSDYEDYRKDCPEKSFRLGLTRVLDTAFMVSLWMREKYNAPLDGQVLMELTRMVMRETDRLERGEIE